MRVAIGKQINNGIVIAVAIVMVIVALSVWQYWLLGHILVEERRQLWERREANLVRASQLQWSLWALSAAVVVLAVLVLRKVRVNLREARVARKSSEEKYRMLFYKSPLPKWIYDEDTLRFLEVNDAAVRLYGYSEEEFQQLTLADIRLKEDAEERSRAGQWRHIRKDGEVIDVEVTAHALELDGRRARMMAVVDVTERRRHELELQVMNADLAKRAEAVIVAQEKERTEIGKELHDNVNQILGASNLYINTAMTDEEMRQELLERSTELVSNAINEIRKISKSLITPGLREIGLIESIEDIIDDLKVAGDRLTIDLDLQNIAEEQIEERRKLTVFRIVQEQLNNIVKHARATRVLVRLSGERDHIVLTVADNGVGFDVSRHRKGVGITNIISRAELFNGRVEIQSMPGEGCVLTVSLPM